MIRRSLEDGACVLRLDVPPRNLLTPPLLEEIRREVVEAGRDSAVRGIVICGDEKRFSSGADIRLFEEIRTPDDAVRLSRVFQEALDAIEDSRLPVVAAMAGAVFGGAIELAMACHVRIAAGGATFCMPEVGLGINPGAGGTQRLPRLVGLRAALEMLLKAETVGAERALELGLVDEVCPAGELLQRAVARARSGLAPVKTRNRAERISDNHANAAALDNARSAAQAWRTEFVSPWKILEAVRVGVQQSFEAGLRQEQLVFAECMQTPAVKNKFYVMAAQGNLSHAAGLSGIRPAEIDRAAVVGLGTMGIGIAQALAAAGVSTIVLDESPEVVKKGLGKIRASLEKRVAQGKLSPQQCQRTLASLHTADRIEQLGDVDLVIEAVFEQLDTKREVLAQIEAACRPETILATNTSTINLDQLAEPLRRPQRLLGMHFFNPAHHMPLVEIIRREATPADLLATVMHFAKRIRKRPVLVRNCEGFLVNRIFVPYLKEAFLLLEEGAGAGDVDAAMVEFGFPMGPLTVSDLAGIDILVNADRVMGQAFAHHGPVAPIALRLVEERHFGQKAGSGVYRYLPGDTTPHPSGVAQGVIGRVQQESSRAPRVVGGEEIVRRLMFRMLAEAFRVVEEGVALSEANVDAATVLGVGFPDFRGGVLKYARDLGLPAVVSQLEELSAQCGARYEPCAWLRKTSH
jgi:3-hydroxyacyl-CoA dehydrogenase